jgi:hypothetical protein
MSINSAAAPSFTASESYCDSLLPLCGCAAQGTSAEDGTLVAFDDNNIVSECSNGTCNSRYGGVTFDCAGKPCTEQQYCTITTGGPAGSEPSGYCNFLGGCSDCSCIGSSQACACAVQDGHVTVTCQAP